MKKETELDSVSFELKHKFCLRIGQKSLTFQDNEVYDDFKETILELPINPLAKPTNETILYNHPTHNYIGTNSSFYGEGFGMKSNYLGKNYFGEFKNGKLNGYGLLSPDYIFFPDIAYGVKNIRDTIFLVNGAV